MNDCFGFNVPGAPATGNRRLIPARGRLIPNPKYAEYKARVRSIAKAAAMQTRYEAPLQIEVEIVLTKCRADIDNVVKVILDALEGIAYDNDRDVYYLRVHRNFDEDTIETTPSVHVWVGRFHPPL